MASAESTGHGEVVSTLADPSGTRQSTEDQLSAAYDQAFPPSATQSGMVLWQIVNRVSGQALGEPFMAHPGAANAGAYDRAVEILNQMGVLPAHRRDLIVQPADIPSEAPNTTGPGDYALVDTGNAVHDYIRVFPRMANRQAAHDAAVQWLNNNGDQFDPAQRRYFQLQRIPR